MTSLSRAILRAVAVALAAASLWACSNDGADPEAFCARSLDTATFAETFSDDFDPSDVGGALASFTTALDQVQGMRDIAPEAIRSDIDVIIDYLGQMIDGLEAADPTSSEPPEIYDDLRSRADEIAAASNRITNYVETNC